MILRFRVLMFIVAFVTGLVTSYSVFANDISTSADVFDRLDGKGPSGKRIDVIEWDGNLEVHAYPKGSLKGLSAKLDDREEGKKVMVVGYRFANVKRPLVRRAILGVPFEKGFKAYVDTTEKDFDKLALSNQPLTQPWMPYKLDAAPAQWYPDGHEKNEETATPPQLADGVIAEPSDSELSKSELAVPNAAKPRRPASVKLIEPDMPVKNKKAEEQTDSLNHFNW